MLQPIRLPLGFNDVYLTGDYQLCFKSVDTQPMKLSQE